jgi:iron complex transport system ATP-binding protein
MARYADRAALLVQGELCAEGTPAEVLDAEVLSRAYQLPVQVLPGPSGAPLVVPAATPSSHMT